MKVLAIDHHFAYDLRELISQAQGKHEVRSISADYFGLEGKRIFAAEVWRGLKEFHDPKHSRARGLWRCRVRRILHEIFMVFPFDLIVSPSDTFFYIRDFRSAAAELGIPFVVALKETTVPTIQLERDAHELKELFPFISDALCVCSERTKKFWLIAGTPEEKIVVTGQPRFDFYFRPGARKSWSDLGFSIDSARRTVLFLSYDPGIYQAEDDYLKGRQPWLQMREETEEILARLASEGAYNVFIKPHPQQPPADRGRMEERIRRLSGRAWEHGIHLVDAQADVRPMILASDIVIGFQTTSLMEAMISAKRTIYTQWGSIKSTDDFGLIPYDKHGDILAVAESPQGLRAAITNEKGLELDSNVMRKRRQFFETFLGPVDGCASQRVWSVIQETYAKRPPVSQQGQEQLRKLLRRRFSYLIQEAVSAWLKTKMWRVAYVAAVCLIWSPGLRSLVRSKLSFRIDRQRRRFRECAASLATRSASEPYIVGSIHEGILGRSYDGWRSLFRRLATSRQDS